MNTCYICGVELNDKNASVEHIIPNACGGKLKSREILCRQCNSLLGETYDSDLVKQLHFFCNMFDIQRERGKNPLYVAADKKIGIMPGGKPILNMPNVSCIENENGMYEVKIEAKDKKTAIHQIRKLRSEKKLLLTDEDIENKVNYAQVVSQPLQQQIHCKLSIGGQNVLRAVSKIAVNFYMMKKRPRKYVTNVVDFISCKERINQFATPYYPNRPPLKQNPNVLSHIIYLYGDKNSNTLACYIELLNVYCYIVKLSCEYDGDDFADVHEYDLLNQKDISSERSDKFFIPHFEIPEKILFEEYRLQLTSRIENAIKNSILRQRIQGVLRKTLLKYPENCIITQQMVDELISEIKKEFFANSYTGFKGIY